MVQAQAKERTFKEASKAKDVRLTNIEAAKAVADAVRTSLGPRGMDKMIAQDNGEVLITNDGATILERMQVKQPAAKMLVELAKAQDVQAGDGTTTVTVICGSLLRKCMNLLQIGIHPTIVSDAYYAASKKAEEILLEMSQPVDLSDRANLLKAAKTSLNSKVVSNHSELLAPIAVDCILKVMDPERPDSVDLKDIKIVKKLGGTVDDSEMVEGLVFKQKTAGSGGPTRVEKAKIALAQFHISPPKSDLDMNVVVSDYKDMDRVLKEERNYILRMVKAIKATGCNVLLLQKSILRDAVSDLALHYLAKAKIMVVKDIEREDVAFISKTLGIPPVAHIDSLKPERLATAALVHEASTGGGSKVVKVEGIATPGRTATVLLHGSNQLMLDEADRSLHDALCVVRSIVHKRFLIAGGAAPEVEVSLRLSQWAQTLQGSESVCLRAFAEALEIVPYTLAENCGLEPIGIVATLRQEHAKGNKNAGLNVKRGTVSDMWEEEVIQPMLVSSSALSLASECVRMILKIDDIVPTR